MSELPDRPNLKKPDRLTNIWPIALWELAHKKPIPPANPPTHLLTASEQPVDGR